MKNYPYNPLSGTEDESYRIAVDVDHGREGYLADLLDERDALKAEVVRLKGMITELTILLSNG
jgi:hypothetical protein